MLIRGCEMMVIGGWYQCSSLLSSLRKQPNIFRKPASSSPAFDGEPKVDTNDGKQPLLKHYQWGTLLGYFWELSCTSFHQLRCYHYSFMMTAPLFHEWVMSIYCCLTSIKLCNTSLDSLLVLNLCNYVTAYHLKAALNHFLTLVYY